MSTNHTPTPWEAFDNRIVPTNYLLLGAPIATVHARKKDGMQDANAAFIVRAVNAHGELVSALRAAERRITDLSPDGYVAPELWDMRAALAKAGAA